MVVKIKVIGELRFYDNFDVNIRKQIFGMGF